MKIRDIKRELRAAAKEQAAMTAEERERAIGKIMTCRIPVRTRANFSEFVREQFCFMDKAAFFWYIVWFAVFLAAVADGRLMVIDGMNFCVLSMAPPVLLLCTADEIAKVYCHGLLEIEYTTKYSVSKVVLLKILLMGICTGGALAAACIPVMYFWGIQYGDALLYTLTPMLCMSGCLLNLIGRIQGQKLIYAAFSLYAALVICVLLGNHVFVQMYTADAQGVWLAVFTVSAVGNAFSVYRLAKRLVCYETVI